MTKERIQMDDFGDIFRFAISLPELERPEWIRQLPLQTQEKLTAHLAELDDFKAHALRVSQIDHATKDDDFLTQEGNVLLNIGPQTELGQYRLVREVSSGGMGIVWEAVQEPLGRRVAVKLMKTGQLASDEERARFEIEANAVASLNHSGIVQIFEVSKYLGSPFFSMEFVSGDTLENIVSGKPLSTSHTVSLIQQIADAVSHAHANNVLHRDLKPANVLLTKEERTKLIDFGIARQLGSTESPTATGQVLGTPAFMAPEQATARGDQITKATDVYGLGAILYFLLTGQPPFSAKTPSEILERVMKDPVRDIQALNKEVPAELGAICLKAMEKHPNDRYPDVKAFQEDLKRFSAGQSTVARPRSAMQRALSKITWMSLSSGVAVLTLIAIAWAVFRGYKPEVENRDQREARAKEPSQRLTEHELNRLVAETLMAEGARFGVFTDAGRGDSTWIVYDGPSELTNEPFLIGNIFLKQKPSSELMRHIRKLSTLNSLMSYGGKPTDNDFSPLSGIRTLTVFGISSPNAGLETLHHVSASNLTRLQFRRCCSDDATLEFICDTWPDLQHLSIGDRTGLCDAVSDTSVPHLLKLPQLRELQIDNVPITDESVSTFLKMTQLELLDIRQTRISDSGAAKLRLALPDCEIRTGPLEQ